MHSLWLFFLKNKSFTYLLMGGLTITGLYSALVIPKESSPEVIVPIGIVSTSLRGASAQDVEQLITNRLEDDIASVENIDSITSSSREGLSIITAQFNADADIEKSIQDLKDAVDRGKVDLPQDANDPVVTKVNFADQPILIVSVTQDVSPAELTALGETLEDEIKKVNGISKVEVTGTRDREIQVIVRKDALLTYNISLEQVVGAIRQANASLPLGSITVSDIDYPINFYSSLETAEEVKDIVVTSMGGVPVYIRDVAFIADGLEKPRTFSRASLGGMPSEQALTLNVYKKSGGDVTVMTEEVRAKLESLKDTILKGASVVVSFDNGEYVKKDLRELSRVGLETVVLVIVILLLTIGWRESLVAGLSIPLSFVIAFIGLYASGNTINFISLFSLILAIGILVDSGIVVAEGIHARFRIYGNAEDAAVATIKEYAWPLIAGTMTTVAVFAPLFFISGITGEFISSIPFTVIFVLIASIFVALGMVPLLAVLITKPHKNRFEELQEEYTEKAQSWYKRFLTSILLNRRAQNRFIASMIIGFFIALSLPIVGLVKVQFFPQDDQDFLFVTVEMPQGTPLHITDRAVREVEEMLYEEPYIDSFVTTVGAGSSFDQSAPGSATKLANITLLLEEERDKTSTELVEVLRAKFSPITSASIKVEQGNSGPPTGAPVVIQFRGDDLDMLGDAASKAENILTSIEGTLDVETSLRDNATEFSFTIDRARAGDVGVTASQIASTLRTAVSGVIASTITTQDNDIDIVVKTDLNPDFINPEETTNTTLESVLQVPLSTLSGTVLLGSLLRPETSESRATISHEDRKRVTEVRSALAPGTTALEVVAEFKKREAELALPDTVTIYYGGENEEVDQSFRDMFLALIAGMVGMLAILVLEFNSFRYALYLLGIVPLSLIGVFGGLALTGQTLSFSSMLGFIALSGVIINHAIILLDSIINRLREDETAPRLHVIVEASAVRLRPIFLTTITTAIGMLPLAFASALWGPLAFAIMFGLMFAMILTLVLVPVLFYRSYEEISYWKAIKEFFVSVFTKIKSAMFMFRRLGRLRR